MSAKNNYNDEAFEGAFEVTAAAFERATGASPLANVNAYAYKDNDDDVASVGETVSVVEDFQEHLHPADMAGHLVPYPAGGEDEDNGNSSELKLEATEDTADDTTEFLDSAVQHCQHEDSVPPKPASRSVVSAGLESIKYLTSLGLLLFSIVVVMASIFSNQTVATA